MTKKNIKRELWRSVGWEFCKEEEEKIASGYEMSEKIQAIKNCKSDTK